MTGAGFAVSGRPNKPSRPGELHPEAESAAIIMKMYLMSQSLGIAPVCFNPKIALAPNGTGD